MPSRPPPSSASSHHAHHRHLLLPLLTVTLTLVLISLLAFIIFLYRKLSYNRTTPFDHHNTSATATPATTPTTPTTVTNTKKNNNSNRFSYSVIRRATGSFSAWNRLGHGGFRSVYKATLPSGQSLAVKLMDSTGSLQGEREFHNALNLTNPHILSLHGFSTDRRGQKLLLVYELMPNGSLQEALLDHKCLELMVWKTRFRVVLDVACGLEYLHHVCEPPVIHGDVKPSNVLLDSDFNAKVGDFGLAKLKTETEDQGELGGVVVVEEEGEEEEKEIGGKEKRDGDDNGSILEEESVNVSVSLSVVTTGLEDGRSPECSAVRIGESELAVASPECGFDKASVESERDLSFGKKVRGSSGRH